MRNLPYYIVHRVQRFPFSRHFQQQSHFLPVENAHLCKRRNFRFRYHEILENLKLRQHAIAFFTTLWYCISMPVLNAGNLLFEEEQP